MTLEHFHSLGKLPVIIEQNDWETEEAVMSTRLRKSRAGILSRPVAFDLEGCFKIKSMFGLLNVIEMWRADNEVVNVVNKRRTNTSKVFIENRRLLT